MRGFSGFGIEAAATIYSLHPLVMPRDPNADRTKPVPVHPEGLAVAEDSPVYVAAPLDVRPPLEEAPISAPPTTVNWDRVSARLPSVPISIGEPVRDHVVTVDTSADHDEREAILRDLRAIAGLDERPDRTTERAVAQRATLARARALRFRLALLDAWSGRDSPGSPDAGALQLDLAIDAMLLVAIADGAPGQQLPVVAEMVEALRGIRGDLPRAALRDRGSAAIAKLTIVGFRGALEQLSRAAVAVPPESRRLSLELAARAALLPEIDDHRLGALKDLERALALPMGSVASAIETARRRRARSSTPR